MNDQTIKSISKELGYSTATISRVINNKKGVSDQTRRMIIDAMNQLGYQPNRIAQSLVKKRSKTIGVIVPDFANDFLGSIVNTIEDALEAQGYSMLLFSTNWNIESEKKKIQLALQSQVDGIILKPISTKTNHFKHLPVPTVLVSQTYSSDSNWVDIDNKKAGILATEHLIKCGYKKIAFIGENPHNIIYTDRYEGYCEALKKYGMEPMEAFYCKNSIDAGYKLIDDLSKDPTPPDALFSCDDTYAIGAMVWANDNNISVPDDFGIVGFNNSTISRLPQIDLTTISQPKEQIGHYAVQMLIYMIKSKESQAPQKIILSPELVIRSTTRITPEK